MKLLIKNIIFILFNYIPIVYKLRRLSVSKISIYKFRNWHFGYCYFVGYKNNQKVFIKIDTKVGVLENELVAYNLLKDVSDINVIKVIDFFKDNKTQIVLFEFLEGRELTIEDIKNNPKYIPYILNVLKIINVKNMIHRDIKLDNFLLFEDKVYIIDFCFAYHLNLNDNLLLKELPFTKLNCLWLKNLGKGLSPKEYEWNDFYAFSNIVTSILNDIQLNNQKKILFLKYNDLIKQEIENNSYEINCKKGLKK